MSLYSFVKELEFNSTKTDRMSILKSSKKCILKFHYYAIDSYKNISYRY